MGVSVWEGFAGGLASCVPTRDQVRVTDGAPARGDAGCGPETNEKACEDFGYNGWLLATLLVLLQRDYGIDLMHDMKEMCAKLTKGMGATQFIFTAAEKSACESRLDASQFSAAELEKAFAEFNGTDGEGFGEIMLEGIRFLRVGLEEMTVGTVAILSIG